MKKVFLTTAMATIFLAACGGGANNGTANAQNAAGANTAANTASGGMSMSPPAAVPPAAPAPDMNGSTASGDLRSQLIGRWGRNNSCAEAMEFRADGGIVIPRANIPPQVKWDLRGNTIVLGAPGEREEPIGSASVSGDTLQLTQAGTGQTTSLIRCP